MVQSNKQGRFSAPAPAAARVRAVNWGAEIKELPATTSAALELISSAEVEILKLMRGLSISVMKESKFNSWLSELKVNLFNKKYELAFEDENYRKVYALVNLSLSANYCGYSQ